MDATDIEERGAHLLGGNFFTVLAAQAKRFFINGYRLVKRADCDAQVIDLLNHFL
jgi:hypothetical protein